MLTAYPLNPSHSCVAIAKILSQIRNSNTPVPVEIYAQAKAKDPPTDAMPKFLDAYTAHSRIGTITKESHTGKLVDEWNKLLSEAEKKFEMVDMAPAVSSFMAVKDEDELVSICSSLMIVALNNATESHQNCSEPYFHTTSSSRCGEARDDSGQGS